MLGFYSASFNTVEANNTFYKMPTEKVLAHWRDQVPANFVFAIKAPQRITHVERLKDSASSLERLFAATLALGDKLGPFLFQLPPFLKMDLPRLREFLAGLPPRTRAAFEFRHSSWFCDEIYAALSEKNCALVWSESEKLTTPFVATSDWGYLRLRREDYVDSDIAAWAERLRAQKFQQAFIYFKHEDAGTGPRLATQLRNLLNE